MTEEKEYKKNTMHYIGKMGHFAYDYDHDLFYKFVFNERGEFRYWLINEKEVPDRIKEQIKK